MPTIWNERYQMNGGGGWDGTLRFTNSPSTDGYATSGANGGYMASNWPSLCASFGLKEPYFSEYYDENLYPTGVVKNNSGTIIETNVYYGSVDPKGSGNPYACQKVVDFGIRHLYETPVIAKKIIKLYYGIDPKKSYYSGGSCGGKEGQISAQKFPELYDGFWIGYPLGGHVAVTFRGMWDTFWGAGLAKSLGGRDTVYSKYKAALHYKTVYDKCDAIDGLKDGMIDDPLKCKFDAMTDLPACSTEEEAVEGVGNTYSSTCFTLAQREALKEIYAGPHKSHGKSWYPGQPLSAEYIANNPSSQTQPSLSSGFGAAINDDRAACMFANIALDPPDGPNFDITTFDWDKDPKAMERTTCEQCYEDGSCETFNIQDTLDGITIRPRPTFNMGGLEPVYAKGAKIVQTHGWSDALVTPLAASRELYETTLQKMGIEKTKSFWKLFLVPGAGHGGGGLSAWPSNTDAFNAMVDWVENGNEPHALIGSRSANVDLAYPADRTRPSCPYPEVARWDGAGDINAAASFTCVPPIDVNIVPETLNLKSKGVFTALITIPRDYDMRDWNLQDVTCEGAPAKFGFAHGNVYYATFRIQDLQDVTPGKSVTFTVKGKFTKAQDALVQASDTVRVF
jgi:feruloyl esterase